MYLLNISKWSVKLGLDGNEAKHQEITSIIYAYNDIFRINLIILSKGKTCDKAKYK